VIRSTPEGVTLDVRVIPRAKKSEIGGTRDGALLVRLNAAPVEGAANEALIAFLADLFHTSRSSIRIVSGERGRQKRVAIAGITPDRVRDILDACSPTS
jgi:hypothetical protein